MHDVGMIETLEDPHLVPYDLMEPPERRNCLKESEVVVDGPKAVTVGLPGWDMDMDRIILVGCRETRIKYWYYLLGDESGREEGRTITI